MAQSPSVFFEKSNSLRSFYYGVKNKIACTYDFQNVQLHCRFRPLHDNLCGSELIESMPPLSDWQYEQTLNLSKYRAFSAFSSFNSTILESKI